MKKLLIICNSTNTDLVQYFKCKIDSLKKCDISFLVFKNNAIETKNIANVFVSSYTKSAFLDKKVLFDFIKSFYLAYIALKNRVKVVHFTTAHISNIFLAILLKPFKVKQVFTIHDLTPHPGKKSLFIKLYNTTVINFLADEIISFSKKDIERQSKRDKFIYMTLSGFEQHINIPKIGEKTILFFGRIESYKGLNNLLEIIKLSNKNKTGFKFIIAGKGMIENIEEFQKLSNVEIINRFIDDNEVAKLFKKATFTILPYDSATQSGVTILSYAYATPIIAYNIGALGEYIVDSKTGFLIGYKDNEKIIKILKNISNQELFDMSKYVIDDFEQKFSIKFCQKKYLNYYSVLLKPFYKD